MTIEEKLERTEARLKECVDALNGCLEDYETQDGVIAKTNLDKARAALENARKP